MHRKVIFSFDNPYQIHVAAKFYRHLDTLNAMEKLNSEPVLGTGFYKGEVEPNVMLGYDDFFNHLCKSEYLQHQESVLVIEPDNTTSNLCYNGYLLYLRDGHSESLGRYKEVTFYEAMTRYDGWTKQNDKYFACEAGFVGRVNVSMSPMSPEERQRSLYRSQVNGRKANGN